MLKVNIPSGIVFSSEFNEFEVVSDADFVDVSIEINGQDIILQERFYLYNGKVTVQELKSLIEDAMREKDLSFATVIVTVTDGSVNLQSLVNTAFCSSFFFVSGGAEQWLNQNFLSPVREKVIGPFVPAIAYAFLSAQQERLCKVFCKGTNSLTGQSCQADFRKIVTLPVGMQGVASVMVKQEECKNALAASSEGEPSDFSVSSIELVIGDRHLSFFVDQQLYTNCEFFVFYNRFNVRDFVCLRGQRKAVTSPSAESAVVNSKAVQYDRKVEKSFSFSGLLHSPADAAIIEDLVTSHFVLKSELIVDSYPSGHIEFTSLPARPILIDDVKLEVSQFEDLNSFEFSYRYDDKGIVSDLKVSLGDIFNDSFNSSYN